MKRRAAGRSGLWGMLLPLAMLVALGLVTGIAPAAAATGPESTHADWLSVLPAVTAIILALVFRAVIPALIVGVWVGVIILYGTSPGDIFRALLDVFHVRVLDVMVDRDYMSILMFTGMIGGMVGIMARSGGMQGVVNRVIRWAHSRRRGQLSVWLVGLIIFFDDYTNTLVVGNTVRPVTDRLRISREKLAYIVDSTAAPVVCIAVFTTWVGYELGLIQKAAEGLGGLQESPVSLLLHAIPYSFYPILAIVFVFLVGVTGRDFGPMYRAEQRCENGEPPLQSATQASMNIEVPEGTPQRAFNAVVPILVLLLTCVVALYRSGEGDTVWEIMDSADIYQALLWSTFLGAATAGLLALVQRILKLEAVVEAWTEGVSIMVGPLVVLVLAWTLGGVIEDLGAADYLVRLGDDYLTSAWIPAVTFVLAGITAFGTGSSWGVMAILLPLVLPVAWSAVQLPGGGVAPADMPLVYATIASVLSGAVWGDHCSPISDTTVLSSASSGCDHIAHVRTQLPYALLVGLVALGGCIVPVSLGVPLLPCLLISALGLYGILRLLGRQVTPGLLAERPD